MLNKIRSMKIQALKIWSSKILGWVRSSKTLQLYIARYKAQYAEKKEKKRLLVDVLLLGAAIAIPIAMLGWHDNSRQKQLTSLPIDKQQYKDGWQIFNAKGSIASRRRKNNSRQVENQERWTIQCGLLQQYLAEENLTQNRTTYQDSLAQSKDAKNKNNSGVKLLCENGAQVSNDELSLKAQSLFYQSSKNGYKIATDTPLAIKINQATIHSARGGSVQSNGDIQLIQDIVFSAPNITINAQKQAQLKNYAGKKQTKIIFEKNVLLQYKSPSKKYQVLAGRAKVTFCQKKTAKANKNCNVLGIESLSSLTLEETVVIKEYPLQSANKDKTNKDKTNKGKANKDKANKGNKSPAWTLTAQTVVMQGRQARYQGGQKQAANILFANRTQVFGQQGAHSVVDNSGILCGNVRVHLGETILKSPCLRYNLNKQQFKLESKKLELELAQRFFKLDG